MLNEDDKNDDDKNNSKSKDDKNNHNNDDNKTSILGIFSTILIPLEGSWSPVYHILRV